MNLKVVGGTLAVVASVAGIGSFLIAALKKPDPSAATASSAQNSASQSTSGANSPNIANVQGNVSLTINAGKSKLDVPSYDFSLQPFPGWRRDPELGSKFNDTMGTFLNKTVYLSITLSEEMTEGVSKDRDKYGRLTFSVANNEDEFGSGGAEYLVHLSKNEKSPFEIRDNVAVLSGYFKIFDINGPRQGYMSVNLRPEKID